MSENNGIVIKKKHIITVIADGNDRSGTVCTGNGQSADGRYTCFWLWQLLLIASATALTALLVDRMRRQNKAL